MSVVCSTLRAVGIGPQYCGYKYLALGIELIMGDGGLQMVKAVYPEIARKYNTSWPCVERAMRTAIGRAWETGGLERFEALTGCRFEHRPTNSQFICTLAEELRRLAWESRIGPGCLMLLNE